MRLTLSWQVRVLRGLSVAGTERVLHQMIPVSAGERSRGRFKAEQGTGVFWLSRLEQSMARVVDVKLANEKQPLDSTGSAGVGVADGELLHI